VWTRPLYLPVLRSSLIISLIKSFFLSISSIFPKPRNNLKEFKHSPAHKWVRLLLVNKTKHLKFSMVSISLTKIFSFFFYKQSKHANKRTFYHIWSFIASLGFAFLVKRVMQNRDLQLNSCYFFNLLTKTYKKYTKVEILEKTFILCLLAFQPKFIKNAIELGEKRLHLFLWESVIAQLSGQRKFLVDHNQPPSPRTPIIVPQIFIFSILHTAKMPNPSIPTRTISTKTNPCAKLSGMMGLLHHILYFCKVVSFVLPHRVVQSQHSLKIEMQENPEKIVREPPPNKGVIALFYPFPPRLILSNLMKKQILPSQKLAFCFLSKYYKTRIWHTLFKYFLFVPHFAKTFNNYFFKNLSNFLISGNGKYFFNRVSITIFFFYRDVPQHFTQEIIRCNGGVFLIE